MATVLVQDAHAAYAATPALRGVTLAAEPGRLTAVLGRNGAGKTTALRAITGLVRLHAGAVLVNGEPVHQLPIHLISRAGVALVPQRRRIFADLTVQENLLVAHAPGRRARPGTADRLARAFDLFPTLFERRRQDATTLSGGEQQMLAIARALMISPSVLLLDEPMEGLAPAVIDTVAAAIRQLRAEGMTIILVEQIVSLALDLADDVYVLDRGTVVQHCTPAELRTREEVLRRYLGVGSVRSVNPSGQ